MANYVRRKEVLCVLKVHYQTLYRMEKREEIDVIRTTGGHRLYNLDKYLKDNHMARKIEKIKICYARVSSIKQKSDLKRQIKELEKRYPNHEIISDIGSGLNLRRKGLEKIIELAIDGRIEEVIVTYKDRLARFGYDLIEHLIEKYSGGVIKVINKKEEETPEEEISKDILQIMNVYVAKINGMRSGRNRRKNNKKY